MKSVAVVLSGCGVFDGSEIHESVLTLLSLDRLGVKTSFFAPDEPQLHVINHINGEEMGEERNVLQESARISRGKIKPLSQA
ncbi:isoprenoid biosynthesis protein ElbB, partial [Enterobacter hormaechei]|nr:isoprenoid biosynthesis protein ElbB [Enterobacter hormaechei]